MIIIEWADGRKLNAETTQDALKWNSKDREFDRFKATDDNGVMTEYKIVWDERKEQWVAEADERLKPE